MSFTVSIHRSAVSLHVSLVAFVCALLGAAFHFHIRKATWATVAGQLLLVGGTYCVGGYCVGGYLPTTNAPHNLSSGH